MKSISFGPAEPSVSEGREYLKVLGGMPAHRWPRWKVERVYRDGAGIEMAMLTQCAVPSNRKTISCSALTSSQQWQAASSSANTR